MVSWNESSLPYSCKVLILLQIACSVSFITCTTPFRDVKDMLDLFVHMRGNAIMWQAAQLYDTSAL